MGRKTGEGDDQTWSAGTLCYNHSASADYGRKMPILYGSIRPIDTLTAMPATRGVKVLRLIGTRTAEEHDGLGCREDLARPGIRRHDNLQKVRHGMTETCERPSPREITALLWYPVTVSARCPGEHLIGLTLIE